MKNKGSGLKIVHFSLSLLILAGQLSSQEMVS